jgi:uncharacterized protein YqeY
MSTSATLGQSLRDRIANDIKDAMRAKDSAKLGALRLVQSAFKNREIELRPTPITEDDFNLVLKKLVKQRKESIEQYLAAKRQDLVDTETAELKLLETYLPAQMDRSAIEALVKKVVIDLNAKTVKEMGNVMKEVIARSGGAADNKIVSELVKANLQ